MTHRRTFVGRAFVAGVLTLAACAPQPVARPSASPSPQALLLDGAFDDWVAASPVLSVSAPGAGPITRVLAQDDARWWYLSLAGPDRVNLQAMPGTLHLLIDADADERTGSTVHGMAGVEFAVEFSRMDKSPAGGRGAGFALRAVANEALGALRSSYELGVAALPTWSADRFELRIARGGATDGFGKLGTTVALRLVYTPSDSAPRLSPVAHYRFRTAFRNDGPPLAEVIPARADGATRIAQWNVSEGSFRRPDRHARLLAAVRPDVVLLDEVYEQITDSSLTAFFASPELAALGTWRFVIARSGGRQRTVVAARELAIRPAETMAFVRYEDGDLDSLRRTVPPAARHLVDIEAAAHVSATGAWVDMQEARVLFVPLDLQSGGFSGNVQDQLRLLQARAIRRQIEVERRAIGATAPVVIGGDFNPVGSYTSVATLQDGLDTDGSALSLARSPRLADQSLITWRNAMAAQFAPGRLDLTLYPDTFFRQVGGFTFTSEDLSDALLAALGLTRDVSARAADHLIVVTDLIRR